MGIQFLRGNPQAPKGHAILFARSTSEPRAIYCTYCIVPPIPMSIAKWLPPLLAAQFPAEEMSEAANVSGMPIPPMLEEVSNLEYLESLAERRGDDLCDIGPISSRDEMARMSMAATSSQEYAQLYASSVSQLTQPSPSVSGPAKETLPSLDELDAEELLIQAMPDRQKLAELGKLVGTARYAIGGHDNALLQDTKQRMQRIVRRLPEKYRGLELIGSSTDPHERGARLAELYLARAYKLLDEEYADIPGIERKIRELQQP